MSISFRLPAVLPVMCCLFLTMQAFADQAYKTSNTAQVMRAGNIERALKVEFDGVPGPPEKMRAIFHEELEHRGFRLDPVSATVMTVRWDGPFREDSRVDRLKLRGQGGSQSRTELGFAIVLGSPNAGEGETTYSLGASIGDRDDEIWKGKVIAVTDSMQKSLILRRMVRQLLDTVGLDVASAGALGETKP